MTETFKLGQSGDGRNTPDLPERVRITDLMTEKEIMERVQAFRVGGSAVASVFIFDEDKTRSVDDIFEYDSPSFSPEFLQLVEDVKTTGEDRLGYDADGRLILASPIWLRCDGHSYLKGCFAGSPPQSGNQQQLEASILISRFVAGTFTDRITVACGSRVAHREYEALKQELKLGGELASMIESVGAGLMVVDRDLRVLWHNAVITKRSEGRDPMGLPCWEAFRATQRCDNCSAMITFETGKPQLGVPERDPSGRIYSRTSTMPILDDDGNVAQVLILINDVSGEIYPPSELVNYKRLIDTSDDFMMICDTRGQTLAANRKLMEKLGYTEQELLGAHGSRAVADEDAVKFHTAAGAARQFGVAMENVNLRTQQGEVIPTQVVITYDEDRDAYEIIFRDISERLRMEAELRARSEELQAQNRKVLAVMDERDRFFRSMSHELRTPLTSIIGFGELLLEDTDDPLSSNQKKLLKRVIGNSHKLLGIVNDLLDLSKIEAGRMEVQLSSVRIDELVSQVVGNLASLAIAKNLDLKVEVHGELPVVKTDEQKLGQILVNLISNAVKFTKEGSITVSAAANDQSFSISVRDTGIGIAQDEISKIFKEFYQSGVQKSGQRGSGLGLAISQRMAALLGGKITAESKVGAGSVFTVTLPITRKGNRPEVQLLS